jgi:hypothetical protein
MSKMPVSFTLPRSQAVVANKPCLCRGWCELMRLSVESWLAVWRGVTSFAIRSVVGCIWGWYGEAKQAETIISRTRTEANRFKASPGWVDHAAGRDA